MTLEIALQHYEFFTGYCQFYIFLSKIFKFSLPATLGQVKLNDRVIC